MLQVTLRTPARLPFPQTRAIVEDLLGRVRGGSMRAAFELVRSLEPRAGKRRPDAAEVIWALDERGSPWTSEQWARRLGAAADSGVGRLALVVGGADGLPRALREGARERISIGACVMPSWLACLVAAEQVYRAHAILLGTPYHRA